MRVELFEHAADGILGQFLLVNAVHVEIGNGHLCNLNLLHLAEVRHAVAVALSEGAGGGREEANEYVEDFFHGACVGIDEGKGWGILAEYYRKPINR